MNCVISKEKGKEDRSGASSAMHYIRFECFVFMYFYLQIISLNLVANVDSNMLDGS